jgi:hypothetical protein
MTEPSQNTPPEALHAAPGGDGSTEGYSDTPEAPASDSGVDGEATETFDRQYVEQLRKEAKQNRLKARRVDDLELAIRDLAIRHHTAGLLVDPESLEWSDDFADDHGLPDGTKITEAAQELISRKPYLGRPRGRLPGQGEHSEADVKISLSELLRG